MEEDAEIAKETLLKIIENQMKDGTPLITNETYKRLNADGYSHDDAIKLIGCALSAELYEVMQNEQPFDEGRYTNNLNALPKLPWNDE
jgi:hypothetical protein